MLSAYLQISEMISFDILGLRPTSQYRHLKLASIHQICDTVDIHTTVSNFLPELLSP